MFGLGYALAILLNSEVQMWGRVLGDIYPQTSMIPIIQYNHNVWYYYAREIYYIRLSEIESEHIFELFYNAAAVLVTVTHKFTGKIWDLKGEVPPKP